MPGTGIERHGLDVFHSENLGEPLFEVHSGHHSLERQGIVSLSVSLQRSPDNVLFSSSCAHSEFCSSVSLQHCVSASTEAHTSGTSVL